MYLSKKQRLNIAALLLLAAHIDTMRDQGKTEEWFGKKGSAWLKQASTLIVKAFEEGLATQLSKEEAKSIHKEVLNFDIHLLSSTEKNLSFPLQLVYTIAEKAIGNTCKGCMIEKYKQCDLFSCLDVMEIPPANNEKHICPYRQ